MKRHPVFSILFALLLLVTLGACSGGDDPADGDTDPWQVGANNTSADMTPAVDMGLDVDTPPDVRDMTDPPLDMPGPIDQGRPDEPDMRPPDIDMSPPVLDMETVEDTPPDMPPAPDMAPPAMLEDELQTAPWYAVIPVGMMGNAGEVGFMAELNFGANGDATLDANGARAGKWEVVPGIGERVRVYDLDQPSPSDPAELILIPIRSRQGELVGLDIIVGPASTIVFEQVTLRSARQYTLSQFVGTWRSIDPLPVQSQQDVYLALRIDNTNIEYGILDASDNYQGFILKPSSTADFLDGTSFWYMIPDGGQTMGPSLAGEITTLDGQLTLYALFSDDNTNSQYSIPLQRYIQAP